MKKLPFLLFIFHLSFFTLEKLQIGGYYRNIGEVYYSEGNYPEALKNFINELKIANESGDKIQIAYADYMGK